MVYHLYGYGHHCALRIKTDVSEEKSELPTVTGVWRTADWHEREIYDMMGIRFRGHPDLRRILMWEGYPVFSVAQGFSARGQAVAMCRKWPLPIRRRWKAGRLSRWPAAKSSHRARTARARAGAGRVNATPSRHP